CDAGKKLAAGSARATRLAAAAALRCLAGFSLDLCQELPAAFLQARLATHAGICPGDHQPRPTQAHLDGVSDSAARPVPAHLAVHSRGDEAGPLTCALFAHASSSDGENTEDSSAWMPMLKEDSRAQRPFVQLAPFLPLRLDGRFLINVSHRHAERDGPSHG